jgi:hypothetical protein
MMKKTPFNTVMYKGTLAAIYGIVIGLILGLLIWALLQISVGILNPSLEKTYNTTPPLQLFVMLGMSFGCVISSIFGAITALSEFKKKN